jgi:HEAT repeat protein
MSSSKFLCIALCLLSMNLPAHAEKPNDSRNTHNDSRSSGALQRLDTGYTKEWGGKSIHQWIADLRHSDPTDRVAAMLALLNFKQAADAVPDVIKRLYEDGDASVRVKAAIFPRWVRAHDTDRTRIIRGLAHAVSHDPQSVVRYEAAITLQSFCPFHYENKEERDALQDLVLGLRSTSTYELREACIVTLMKAGVDPKTGPDPRVTDELVAHANPMFEAATRVRIQAIMALGVQGRPRDPRKFDSVMNVLKMPANFHSKRPSVRIWSHVAVIALEGKKDNKKELDTIAGYLKDREAATRIEAVMALGALGEKAQEYVSNILDMLKREREDNPMLEAAVANALGNMNNTGANVLNALIKMTEEDKPERFPVIWSACNAFVALGVNNAEVMKALDKILDHKSLQAYQKKWIEKVKEELENPQRKKLVKETPKGLEKEVAPQQNKRR